MYLGKKNGGVISVYVSILLAMTCMIVATLLLRLQNEKERTQSLDEYHRRHLAYLESIYYIRNEIYDGYFAKLSYESNELAVQISFDKKNKLAKLELSMHGRSSIHGFLYDKECRCIVKAYEEDDITHLNFNEENTNDDEDEEKSESSASETNNLDSRNQYE